MVSANDLAAWARAAGFAECALCDAEGFDDERRLVVRQPPLAERRQLRFSPSKDLPQAKSLAVLLWPYEQAGAACPGYVFVDSYYRASNAAYHAARQLEQRLTQAGCFARANVSYPAKRAALRAGMGITGKNGLLITPRYGTRVVIILLATDIEPPPRAQTQKSASCAACGRCAASCPSGALSEEGMTHPERCMRNFMMEGIVVPAHLRSRMGMRLIGCDICQRVCPMQPRSDAAAQRQYALDALITADDAAFSAAVASLSQEIGRNVARPQRVRAQAAILAGNSGNPAYLPVLRVWARSDFEAVRTHAAWAVERIERAQGGT